MERGRLYSFTVLLRDETSQFNYLTIPKTDELIKFLVELYNFFNDAKYILIVISRVS